MSNTVNSAISKIFETSPNSLIDGNDDSCKIYFRIIGDKYRLVTIDHVRKFYDYSQCVGNGWRLQALTAYLRENGYKTRLDYEEEITQPKP